MKLSELKLKAGSAGNLKIVKEYRIGYLDISNRKLTSLEGCPEKVFGTGPGVSWVEPGNFNCSGNYLTSLKGCPKEVDRDFNFSFNNVVIESLEGCPEKVGKDFECIRSNLKSVKHCTQEINGVFTVNDNLLSSLEGGPTKVKEGVQLLYNQLSSFEHFPKHIGECLTINYNKFTSFKDIDKHIEFIGSMIYAIGMNITSGYSDLFGIDGLRKIFVENIEIQKIVNKYLPSKDLINFQDEMIKAGFESYL